MFDPASRKILIGLMGAGGFARGVMPFAQRYISTISKQLPRLKVECVFVDKEPNADFTNECRLFNELEFFEYQCDEKFFNVAISSSAARSKIAHSAIQKNLQPISLFASTSIVYDKNQIDDGAIICDHVIISPNVFIGCYFHANIYSYIEHDCKIGDYVTFAPRVSCNGNVTIEDHAYIGAGAIIKQGTSDKPIVIGEGAVIGMGAVVTKSVAPYTTVIGNPARIM